MIYSAIHKDSEREKSRNCGSFLTSTQLTNVCEVGVNDGLLLLENYTNCPTHPPEVTLEICGEGRRFWSFLTV